jgi:hypothetical protein
MSRIVRYVENVCTATQSQRRAASADPLASVGDPPLFSLVSLQPQVSYVLNADVFNVLPTVGGYTSHFFSTPGTRDGTSPVAITHVNSQSRVTPRVGSGSIHTRNAP